MLAVLGIGTNIGKTIVSAIVVQALKGAYWKPIQCGHLENSDTCIVKKLVPDKAIAFYSETYKLKAPLSPHQASKLEGIEIRPETIIPPKTKKILIIESAGGLLVPLNNDTLMIDIFAQWDIPCLLVSKHYLGSINHTLLSVEALKQRKLKVQGLIFNGKANSSSEQIIEKISGYPVVGRLDPEPFITPLIIKKYALEWQTQLQKMIV